MKLLIVQYVKVNLNWSHDQMEWVIYMHRPFHSEESPSPSHLRGLIRPGASLGVLTGIEPDHLACGP
jgi:hypothetical protein